MFHTKNIQESLSSLECSAQGLSSSQASERLAHYGKNSIPEAKKSTLLGIFLAQFKSSIIYVLLIAAIISFIIKDFSDGGFILAVLFINAFIGTYQEYKAFQRADALKKVLKTYVSVLRDGERIELISEEITPGDIVFFESGIKVPSDVRLIQTHNLQVDESLLTGESVEVRKDCEYISDDIDEPLGDRKNMLYAGSMVVKGRGIGVVSAVGYETEIGKIALMLAESQVTKAPLVLRMERFSFNIAKVIGVVVLVILAVGLYQQTPLKEIFFLTVAIAVSSIPEGLPVAITVALSVASSSMSKKNVIVRKLSAIEGLGSCTLIASDKTGTMTQNSLSVEHFITLNKIYGIKEEVSQRILQAELLCNEATCKEDTNEMRFVGDQVDVALAKYALNMDTKLLDLKDSAILLDSLAYESENGYSAVLYSVNTEKIHFIKGSPEIILQKCSLNESQLKLYSQQVDDWASKGFRNIALAYKRSDEEKRATSDYVYLGFAAIMDPLRDGVKEAVASAQSAGIEVVMVTGDHPNTAFFISKELGVAISKDEVMTGVEVSHWHERGAYKEEIAHKRVFARISPEQKQLIVKTFQELGHFVAVTGDGVNDAPALKHANIGIAMGKSGTDVARESSDMILTDDSFGSIVNGIKEGRVAYDNIRKVIHLLISTGFAEIVLILLSMLFFVPIPLLPVQLLWLNLVTNGIQDVALAFEREEPGVLKRKPRNPDEPIFNNIMISRVVVGGLYMGISAFTLFYILHSFGYSDEVARNLTLLLMVLFENVHVFNSRTENHSVFKIDHRKNKFLLLCVIIAQGIHALSMYVPFMQSILHIQPVSLEMWTVLLLVALFLMGVMEIEKVVRRRYFDNS